VTLRDAIHSLPDGEMCYIGAASAYIWIGKKEDAEEALAKASTDAFHQLLEVSIPNAIYKLTAQTRRQASIAEAAFYARRAADTEQGDLSVPAAKELPQLNQALDAARKKSARLSRYIDNLIVRVPVWTDFLDREVREIYPHVIDAPFGTTILFSGAETGKYWFYAEMRKQEAHDGQA
jgi:hypothetical protein